MNIPDEVLKEVVAAFRRAVDHLHEWVACKDALEKAGFNMDDTRNRAEEGRAALASLRKAMEDGKDGCKYAPDLMAGGTDCALCGRAWEDHAND